MTKYSMIFFAWFATLSIYIIIFVIGCMLFFSHYVPNLETKPAFKTEQERAEYMRLSKYHGLKGRGYITYQENGHTYFIDDTGRKGVFKR